MIRILTRLAFWRNQPTANREEVGSNSWSRQREIQGQRVLQGHKGKSYLLYFSLGNNALDLHIHSPSSCSWAFMSSIQYINRRNMPAEWTNRRLSIESRQHMQPSTAATAQLRPQQLYHQQSPLLQRSFGTLQQSQKQSNSSTTLPVVPNLGPYTPPIHDCLDTGDHNSVHAQSLPFPSNSKRTQAKQQDTQAPNRIHQLPRRSENPFAQMFYGRCAIRGQDCHLLAQSKLKRSQSQQTNIKLPSNLYNPNNRAIKISIEGRSVSQLNMQRSVQLRRQNHLSRLQNNSYNRHSQKQNDQQEQRIGELLNRAKSKIQREELFRLSDEKQRILNVKLRVRIKSDLAQKKLKERIERVCAKMKALSEEKQERHKLRQARQDLKKQQHGKQQHGEQQREKQERQGAREGLPKADFRKAALKQLEAIGHFKHMVQNKAVRRLVLR